MLTPISDKCPIQQCDGTGLIHMRNLQTFQDKLIICPCREEKEKELEIREISKIPTNFQNVTVNSFDINIYKEEGSYETAAKAKLAATNYVKHFEKFRDAGKGLFIYSAEKGSGKTRLACSIANALIKVHDVKVHFTTTSDLLDNIRKTFGNNSPYTFEDIIHLYKNVEVLVLDDVGVENPTAWVAEKFTQILNERMERKKVTIFTSNMNIDSLNFQPKGHIGLNDETERIVSRINKMSIEIELPNEKVRDYIAEEENNELSELLFEGSEEVK